MQPSTYPIVFTERTQLATDIWQYDFRPVTPVGFIPGQYAHFSFPFSTGDPRGEQRTMTIISLPSDDTLSFVTRLPSSPSVFKTQLARLAPGDRMLIDEPSGDIVLPRLSSVPLVFVAGGIGVASYVSMLRDLMNRQEVRSISFLYAVRSGESKIFSDVLHSFPFASYKEYASPHSRLTATDIVAAAMPGREPLYYLSGTESFVMDLRRQLEQAGLDHSRIVFDYFTGY